VNDRCPHCGHPVESFFDHIDIDCEHDMTPEQIAALRAEADRAIEPRPKGKK
jgi:hypothetical protein